MLDDFYTVEHAREAYGVVVDLETGTVDVAGTKALRSRTRADPRRGDSRSAAADRRRDSARRTTRVALAAGAANRMAAPGSGVRRASGVLRRCCAALTDDPGGVSRWFALSRGLVAGLNERLGDDWSFDVQRHHRNGGGIEVTGELQSNGTRVQRTGTSNGNRSLPLGAQIEIASEAAFRSCAEEMLGAESRVSVWAIFSKHADRRRT